jgi:hypothetical protein
MTQENVKNCVKLSKSFVNRGVGSHFPKFNGKSTPFLVPPHTPFLVHYPKK